MKAFSKHPFVFCDPFRLFQIWSLTLVVVFFMMCLYVYLYFMFAGISYRFYFYCKLVGTQAVSVSVPCRVFRIFAHSTTRPGSGWLFAPDDELYTARNIAYKQIVQISSNALYNIFLLVFLYYSLYLVLLDRVCFSCVYIYNLNEPTREKYIYIYIYSLNV